MNLVLQEVAPSHKKWPVFLDHAVAYIVETWPAVCRYNTTLDAFKVQYEKELVARIKEGGRGLFFVSDGTKDVGIINAYITKNKEEVFLHIAEFCVFPEERRHGYGRKMVQLIEEWGRSQGATKMFVEVDKDLLIANFFWRSLPGLQLDPSGVRNIYQKWGQAKTF